MALAAVVPDDWRSWPDEAKYRLRWRLQARDEQLPPAGDWFIWLILAGRGYGKTRTAAEDFVKRLYVPDTRHAIVARTFADGRDTCVEGESGILACLPPSRLAEWNRSLGELYVSGGGQAKLFTSEKPDQLRGPQHHSAWCEEYASWIRPEETWDNLMFGLRLGQRPQAVVTSTPKPRKHVRDLVARKDIVVTRGNTYDNIDNLAPSFVAEIKRRYEGTRLGRQEIYGELIEDVEGALWSRADIEEARVVEAPPLDMVGVGVDPSISTAGEQGTIAAGINIQTGRIYVLGDYSISAPPRDRAKAAVTAYYTHDADGLVIEDNQGGDMVEEMIEIVDPRVPVRRVRSSRGKRIRAEPVAMLYEQRRVSHVGFLPELEDELCSWVPGESDSPNRLDALVHIITALVGFGAQETVQVEYEPRRGISPL